MSEFASEVLSRSLGELRGRRAKLEAFIKEAGELDLAIREMERLCRKIGIAPSAGRPVSAVPSPAKPSGPPKEGTNADRVLTALRDHPRGLSTSVAMREANVAHGSISLVLNQLEEQGLVTKVGRGFWRIASESDHAVDVA